VLHSPDDGRSWREIPDSYSHNSDAIASFADPRDGWIMAPNGPSAEPVTRHTEDGGRHWHELRLPGYYVYNLAYLGRGRGFAQSTNIYSKKAALAFTRDQGRRWRSRALPSGLNVDRMAFRDSRAGILAGCLQRKQILVLATTDAGGHWSRTFLHAGDSPARDIWCAGSVVGLSLGPNGVAFLLLQKGSFLIGDTNGYAGVWKSGDFGRSWQRVFWSAFTEPVGQFIAYDGPYRLGGLVVLFENSSKNGPWAHFSSDGGATWQQTRLAKPVSGCAETPGRLVCAGSRSFDLAVIAPL
jgi:hypothetical protein